MKSNIGESDARAFSFRLTDMPLGGYGSHLSVAEVTGVNECGEDIRLLGLGRRMNGYSADQEKAARDNHLIFLRPRLEGRDLPFAASATPAAMQADVVGGGRIDLCYEGQDRLRVRGRGTGLRISGLLREHEAAIDRLDGTFQVCFFDSLGELLIEPLKGGCTLASRWDWTVAGTRHVLLDVAPDGDGAFELCIHYAGENTRRLARHRSFEACAGAAAEAFVAWRGSFPRSGGASEEQRLTAAYTLWACCAGPMGRITNRVLTERHRGSATGWQSALAAMAMTGNPDEALDMLLSPFAYQDAYGQLPSLVDDKYVEYRSACPPYQGLALMYLTGHAGVMLTADQSRRLYTPLKRWCEWWMRFRAGDDGIPLYRHSDECAMDWAWVLPCGFPVYSPELMAYIILLMDALSMLAGRTGSPEEARAWGRRARELTDALIREFWDGRGFIARAGLSREIVGYVGVQRYLPLALGHRLPERVLGTLCASLEASDAGLWQTPEISGESCAAAMLFILTGLLDAGQEETAKRLLEGWRGMGGPERLHQGIRTSSASAALFLALDGLTAKTTPEPGAAARPGMA